MHNTDQAAQLRGHTFLPSPQVLDSIPRIYGNEGTPVSDRIVWVHYFAAVGDWWITEKDHEEPLAYGYVRLSAFPEGAEWGYVDLDELAQLNVTGRNGVPVIVERDLNWTPRPWGAVLTSL